MASPNFHLSIAQERLWCLSQMEGTSATYHMSRSFHIEGCLDIKVLEKAIDEVVRRHAVLRTTFSTLDGLPVQAIDPAMKIPLQVIEGSNLNGSLPDWLNQATQQPFDLDAEPLLRVKLVQLKEEESVLLIIMHHLIGDDGSMEIFINELASLYAAYCHEQPSPLPPLPLQYSDYHLYQRQGLQADVLETQLGYWEQQLAELPALLELPTDYSRLVMQTFRGQTHTVQLPLALSQDVKALAQQQGVSLFMVLLEVFQLLLYRYSGQQDIVVGTPVANRQRAELEALMGLFANTLALRVQID
ncbi:MAG: condensation domain-containing protein, partial [Cyanobacteria bacterium P01_D01_bin.44]